MKEITTFPLRLIEKVLGARKIARSTHTALLLFIVAWVLSLQTMIVTVWLIVWILSLQ